MSRPRRVVVALGLLALAAALLTLPLVPGLRVPQLALTAKLAAAAVVLLGGLVPRRVRAWIRGPVYALLAIVVGTAWLIGVFLLDPDFGFIASRELRYTVQGRGARFYVYQVSAIPDGIDGADVYERRGILRTAVLHATDVDFADDLFDGRTRHVGPHRLRLGVDGRAWIDGRAATVTQARRRVLWPFG
jgi:hypothetical protein